MLVQARTNIVPALRAANIKYLLPEELERLTRCFEDAFEQAPLNLRKARGRHLAMFLLLKHTGCRLGEAVSVDDVRDIDWRNQSVRLITLKQKRQTFRTVPIPSSVLAFWGRLLAEFPDLRGKLFKMSKRNFNYAFQARCREAGIAKELSHPHVLRHTYAIMLTRSGVPLAVVQKILGHRYLSSTSVYLQFSDIEVRQILQAKGFL